MSSGPQEEKHEPKPSGAPEKQAAKGHAPSGGPDPNAAKKDEAAKKETGKKETAPPPPQYTVLVVDDNPNVRNTLRLTLQKGGFIVLEAPSGRLAVSHFQAKEGKIDAILMDLVMPAMDGFEVCKRIRELPSGDATPILICTAEASKGNVIKALQNRLADDFIVKPFQPPVVLNKIRRLLAGKHPKAPPGDPKLKETSPKKMETTVQPKKEESPPPSEGPSKLT